MKRTKQLPQKDFLLVIYQAPLATMNFVETGVMHFKYPDGSRYKVTMPGDGTMSYTCIRKDGSQKSTTVKLLSTHNVSSGVYMLTWRETSDHNPEKVVITQVHNFNRHKVYTVIAQDSGVLSMVGDISYEEDATAVPMLALRDGANFQQNYNGATNGVINGASNGATNGVNNGASNGATNGVNNGATNGVNNIAYNGATNGNGNGSGQPQFRGVVMARKPAAATMNNGYVR
jgi:hypothetical protein